MTSIFCKTLSKRGQNLLKIPGAIRNVRAEHSKLEGAHRVTDLERKILIWTKRFKSAQEVPAYIEYHVIERARDVMRIKLSSYMIAITATVCTAVAYIGHQHMQKGERITEHNLEAWWHRMYGKEE